MVDSGEKPEWQQLLAGGFAYQTAPFAVHPLDERRANESVRLARQDGVTLKEYLEAARDYLSRANGWPTSIEDQLQRVRNFVGSRLTTDG